MAASKPKEVVRPGRHERVDNLVVWVEGSSGELCDGGCEPVAIHRTATAHSCAHGSWKFTEPGAPKLDAPEIPTN